MKNASLVCDPYNVIITGVGGQGNVLASRVLGDILAKKGFQVTIGETFGASQRGGAVMSHLKLGAIVLLAVGTAACASSSDAGTKERDTHAGWSDITGSVSNVTGSDDEVVVVVYPAEIEAIQYDGVWVFHHDPGFQMDAALVSLTIS